jgi:hypothetical protein
LRKAHLEEAIATWTVQRQPNPGLGEWLALIARKNIFVESGILESGFVAYFVTKKQ